MIKVSELFSASSLDNLQAALGGDVHTLIVHSPDTRADAVLASMLADLASGLKINIVPVRPMEGETSISIAAAREVAHVASMSSNKQTWIVISPASMLTKEAQNSLLKTLEQPSISTKFLLVSDPSKLLPTIVSRAQVFALQAIKADLVADKLGLGKIDQGLALAFRHDLDQLVGLSEDKAKLISARQQLDMAKAIVSGKIAMGDIFALDKQTLSQLIELCLTITEAQLQKVSQSSLDRLHKQYKTLSDCQRMLPANVSPKLVAVKLAML